MKLKRIILNNYRQHRNVDVTFNGLLVGILGRNGSGKSHFIEAILYALTGDYDGVKDELTAWGATDGSVTLVFTHKNVEYTIYRATNTNTATLSTDDGEIARGIKKVNASLEEILGVDKTLYKNAVFAKQAEIDAVLFTEPKNRALGFQRLSGLGDAKKVHETLKDVISANPIMYNYQESLDEAVERKVNIVAQIEELEQEQKTYENVDITPIITNINKLTSTIDKSKLKIETINRLATLREDLKLKESKLNKTIEYDEYVTCTNNVPVLAKKLEELRLARDTINALNVYTDKKAETEGEIIAYTNKIESLVECCNLAKETLTRLKSELDLYKKLAAVLSS